MADKIFMKGSEAVAEAAIRAGCRFFAGYPITPQNEVPEYFARKMPQVGGVFLQGESEIAAANMVYGSASSGTRSMTSSASCGISLKSEAISYMAGADLPVVIANFQRGGPGVGTIQPSQQDYFQATKASGNGGFRMLVLAPGDVQEAVDMTYEAFDLADKYRKPVYLLLDGFTGTMMEPVELPEAKTEEEIREIKNSKEFAANGRRGGKRHVIACGPSFSPNLTQQKMNERDAELYAKWEQDEVDFEADIPKDSELIVTAYGISGRIARSAVAILREEGYKVGFIRPKKVYPFPTKVYEQLDYSKLRGILCAEMSIPAQFGLDVESIVHGRTKMGYALSSGGLILERSEIIEQAKKLYGEK